MTEPNHAPPELRTARASVRPCQMHTYHSPRVVQTAGHHRHPIYLQMEVYGEVRDPELLWLCANDHTATHEVISWRLGRARKPDPMPGWRVMREAARTVDWYRQATNAG